MKWSDKSNVLTVCRQRPGQQEYQQLHYNLGHKITAIVATGNGLAYSTGRLSYTFGLQVCGVEHVQASMLAQVCLAVSGVTASTAVLHMKAHKCNLRSCTQALNPMHAVPCADRAPACPPTPRAPPAWLPPTWRTATCWPGTRRCGDPASTGFLKVGCTLAVSGVNFTKFVVWDVKSGQVHDTQGSCTAGKQAGVAGGTNTLLLPITSCTISSLGALSPVARCKTFDASADGCT